MKRKLGIVTACLPGVAEIDALDAMKAAGFEAFFTGSTDPKTTCALREKSERLGMSFDFIHAPFSGINEFWRAGLDYFALYNKIKEAIDSAAASGCNMIVLHPGSGWTPPPVCDIGFERFDSIVEYALKKNVRIAFENIRNFGRLACLLERYMRVPEVGFCYDCGHEHCYTETVPFVTLYGNRMLCTHIHDNFGRSKEKPKADTDIHIMPFDGDIDFKEMMDRINGSGYTGSLILELHKKDKYAEVSDEEFLRIAYDRLKKISEL